MSGQLSLLGVRACSRAMDLRALYQHLDRVYSLGTWWPAESPLEVMVGAILVQRTNWKNAALALRRLKEGEMLSIPRLGEVDLQKLQAIIRPAGFSRQKAVRIQELVRFLDRDHGGDVDRFLSRDTSVVRQELLQLSGVGKETADAILLFAGNHPTFVAASYVSRVLDRTGVLSSKNYDEIREFVLSRIDPEPEECARLYSLLVHHAQSYCKSKPHCDRCPLSGECSYPQEEKDHVAQQGGEQ